MSDLVIFNGLAKEKMILQRHFICGIMVSLDNLDEFKMAYINSESGYILKLKKQIQPKEQVFFLRNIIKAIDDGFVDFTDDKLYDFSFENMRAKDAGGVNNRYIDYDLKADYKKEFNYYYKQMLDLINAKYDLKFAKFMQEMSIFFTMVLTRSKFHETPFELREKFYEYLTDKFVL